MDRIMRFIRVCISCRSGQVWDEPHDEAEQPCVVCGGAIVGIVLSLPRCVADGKADCEPAGVFQRGQVRA